MRDKRERYHASQITTNSYTNIGILLTWELRCCEVKFMNYPEDVRKRMEADTSMSLPTPELHSVLTWSEGNGLLGASRSAVIEDDIPVELRRVNFKYAGAD